MFKVLQEFAVSARQGRACAQEMLSAHPPVSKDQSSTYNPARRCTPDHATQLLFNRLKEDGPWPGGVANSGFPKVVKDNLRAAAFKLHRKVSNMFRSKEQRSGALSSLFAAGEELISEIGRMESKTAMKRALREWHAREHDSRQKATSEGSHLQYWAGIEADDE